ncbi:hypothetical protein DB790_03175 [Staphylococcus capitis]|uniref:Ig-like domain-containing protein n=1 Tax=Staphylococcus capitis TaxID=29388 RepID=UPI000F5C33FB|nr:Ig-like domain-containing protein [Staphylococcus capitis]RQX47407.1 hypothetical protein DB790_03175 [Staphylococcus capitis]
MKENIQKQLFKTTIKTIIAFQGMIAIGILTHNLSGNQLKAFAAENRMNNEQVTTKESVKYNQLNGEVQNNNNKTAGSIKSIENKQQTYASLNTTQQKQIKSLTKSYAGTLKQSIIPKSDEPKVNTSKIQKSTSKLQSTKVTTVPTKEINDKKLVEQERLNTSSNNIKNVNTPVKYSSNLNKSLHNIVAPKATTSSINVNRKYTVSSNTTSDQEKEIRRIKKYNDERMSYIQGNSTYKYGHYDTTYQGILGIETDKVTYKPGETVRIYTEHNKDFVKPIYNEAKLFSHRYGGWYISDPPYYFDRTAYIGRTTRFYKKANGNWESIIEIKLPDKMVDEAFDLDIKCWNDDYDSNSESNFNDIVIKVINDNTADPLVGYDGSAFDASSTRKADYDDPKVVNINLDKKVYNPNDVVTLTAEIEDESDLMFVSAEMSTVEPYGYERGSHQYIPMQFTNTTRTLTLLDNGNWQVKFQFKLPDYIKTSVVQIDQILAADKYGNEMRYDPVYDNNKLNSQFKVERTENVQSFSVDPIADFSTEIRGKASSGMTMYAYVNGKKIGQASVVDGKYFMKIPKQLANSKIQLYTVNKYKNKSKVVTITVLDRTAPKKPTVSKMAPRMISGKGEKGSIVYIYKGSTKLGSATVSSKGTYSINIRPQKKGTTLVIYAKDKAKNKSASIKLKVK